MARGIAWKDDDDDAGGRAPGSEGKREEVDGNIGLVCRLVGRLVIQTSREFSQYSSGKRLRR